MTPELPRDRLARIRSQQQGEKRRIVRDLVADAVGAITSISATDYDVADRVLRTLAYRGWWVVWGADVARLHDVADRTADRLATAEVALAAARRLVLVCSTDGATFSPACRRCPSCELASALAALDAGAAEEEEDTEDA